MDDVRIGIVGIGGMGSHHARYLLGGRVRGATLTAVCDVGAERLAAARAELNPDLQCFLDLDEFLAAGVADAVLIATTHYHHPAIARKCFERGLHVLTEKPAGVYTRHVRQMNEAAEASGKVFAIMYNQRTDPLYRRLREMVAGGELGELKRSNWIATSWYRPQSYYDSGGWRATWAGEGGGVLLNQAPHQLDLWQWCCGMPGRLRAFCYFGKYHAIEVEDDVTAFVEYPNGATGVFVTGTGDAPGSNRLEVTGDRGKAVIEDGRLTFWKLTVPEREFNRRHREGFGSPEAIRTEFRPESARSLRGPGDHESGAGSSARRRPFSDQGNATGHAGITQNFVDAIRDGAELLAPGVEGIRGLALANSMLLSAWSADWVTVPPDEDRYFECLQERIRSSPGRAGSQ